MTQTSILGRSKAIHHLRASNADMWEPHVCTKCSYTRQKGWGGIRQLVSSNVSMSLPPRLSTHTTDRACVWARGPRPLLLQLFRLLVAGVPPELPGTDYYTDFPTSLRARLQTPRELRVITVLTPMTPLK